MIRFRQFLNEGGSTFASTNRINQENVEQTLTDLYKVMLPILSLKKKDIAAIGSTGKKAPGESSGDIDLAVNVTPFLKANKVVTVPELFKLLTKKMSKIAKETHENTGLGVFAFLWPISNVDGQQPDMSVQVDLMMTDNIEWASWTYYSPFWKDTKYKGAVRNLLLRILVKFVYMDIRERDEDGNPTVWEKYVMDTNRGLFRALQTNIGAKGKKIKNRKVLEKVFISADIDKVIHMILGPKATRLDTLSFESLWKFINSNRFNRRELLPQIIKFFLSETERLGYVLPNEIPKI